MIVPGSITDSQLIAVVAGWIERLADQEYAEVANELGFAQAFGEDPATCIRRAIECYRSAHLYPGIEEFRVTATRDARGGNPDPLKRVTRYQANDVRMWGTVDYSVPLNGKWSDLVAQFVLFDAGDAAGNLYLSLEGISQ